ncbi:MAG: GNAT family N-acetyltransferase [Saccharofermentans sp.]|nr:GNAT family N-acetyltransferase [Saccharofermentans sp.]
MIIKKCTIKDVKRLAELNKQLIEDEKSDNKMNLYELEVRMRSFLEQDYCAYYFMEDANIIGYALVNINVDPLYLRQFLIERAYRRNHYGKRAVDLLLQELKVDSLDIEVLSWNEVGMKFWEDCGFIERSRYMRLSK